MKNTSYASIFRWVIRCINLWWMHKLIDSEDSAFLRCKYKTRMVFRDSISKEKIVWGICTSQTQTLHKCISVLRQDKFSELRRHPHAIKRQIMSNHANAKLLRYINMKATIKNKHLRECGRTDTFWSYKSGCAFLEHYVALQRIPLTYRTIHRFTNWTWSQFGHFLWLQDTKLLYGIFFACTIIL